MNAFLHTQPASVFHFKQVKPSGLIPNIKQAFFFSNLKSNLFPAAGGVRSLPAGSVCGGQMGKRQTIRRGDWEGERNTGSLITGMRRGWCMAEL